MGHTALSGVLAPVTNTFGHTSQLPSQQTLWQRFCASTGLQSARCAHGEDENCGGHKAATDGYSPIQQLLDRAECDGVVKLTHIHRAVRSEPACKTHFQAPNAAQAVQPANTHGIRKPPSLDSTSEHQKLCKLLAECSGESAGPVSDRFKFRYDTTSPEEGYSPIAGMTLRPARSQQLERKGSWLTHIDFDGAVCSEAVCMPLALTVRMNGCADSTIQVCPQDVLGCCNNFSAIWL